jgi:RNA polymerase sigma-70 factor (ECF subfamily)
MLLFVLAVFAADEDRELIRRLQNRDPDAVAQLYDRYGRAVYAVIVRIVQDGAIAEDLVQETFLRVWNRAAGFDAERGAAGPWLLAVARNRAIDYVRSAGKSSRRSVEFSETEHPSLFVDLPAELMQADAVRRARKALLELDPNQRRALELAYFEGLSQTEVAERMGQPLGTVKTWMRRGMQRLREHLGATAPA